ncbi:hypothetical protein SUDANB96_00074 [Streptomyces sp. enrichment culture]
MRRKLGILLGAAAITASSALVSAPTAQAATCGVDGNTGTLWCTNQAPKALYAHRSFYSDFRDNLRTTYSSFACYGYGDSYQGNSIWYWTQGDDYGAWGNIWSGYVHIDPGTAIRLGMKKC